MSAHGMRKRNPNVALTPSAYELARRVAAKRGVPITELVSNEVEMHLRKQELEELMVKPFLILDSYGERTLYIKDMRKSAAEESAAVNIRYTSERGNEVYLECAMDKSTECVHVAFALGLPQLGKLSINKKKLVEILV